MVRGIVDQNKSSNNVDKPSPEDHTDKNRFLLEFFSSFNKGFWNPSFGTLNDFLAI